MSKNSVSEKIRQMIRKYPKAKARTIATDLNTTTALVYAVQAALRKKAKKSAPPEPVGVVASKPSPDPVNHPAHYKIGGIETIDFIEAKKLNYNLGNVVKYITRADHKGNRKQDLEKAMWYLQREIGNL